MTIPVIHDGDHGGDDFVTTLLFAAYPDYFKFLGVTTVTGNAGAVQAARNAGQALTLAGRPDVPIHIGADAPLGHAQPGDNAFGGNGLGNIDLPVDPVPPGEESAVDWMARTLYAAPSPVTLCVTGPATNIALLLRDHPNVIPCIERIVIMGGGLNPAGNIKPHAEFNFFMDPAAADLVLNAGVPLILHTLDTTQQAVYTKARQESVRSLPPIVLVKKIDAIMRITEELERKSFGSEGSFFHDHQVCAWLAMPENYDSKRVSARVRCDELEPGRLAVTDDKNGFVSLVTAHRDTDRCFEFILEGLRRVLSRNDG